MCSPYSGYLMAAFLRTSIGYLEFAQYSPSYAMYPSFPFFISFVDLYPTRSGCFGCVGSSGVGNGITARRRFSLLLSSGSFAYLP